MGVAEALRAAHDALAARAVDHALIGGLALAALGAARATFDVDLLVDGDRHEDARAALVAAGFGVFAESADVLQVAGPGAVDCLFARRAPTREMLAAARPIGPFGVKCVGPEGLVALKIQAYVNDRRRELRDQADILGLLRARRDSIDWAKLEEYADLLGEWKTIEKLRATL